LGGFTVSLKFYQNEPHEAVVQLEGAFDFNTAADIRKELIKIAKIKGLKTLEIDFSLTSKLDTAGIAVLVEVFRLLRRKGGEFNLVGLNENARQMIRLARLGEVFDKENQL
jgi:anti-anti-sigma factor